MDLETGKKLIQAMHEPYDSITRWVYDVMPVVPSYDKELTIVMFPFTEKRYKKRTVLLKNLDSMNDTTSEMEKSQELESGVKRNNHYL